MKNKNLVVIQLSGGNDYLNTIVPYESGLYYDYRPNMGLKDDSIIPVDNKSFREYFCIGFIGF